MPSRLKPSGCCRTSRSSCSRTARNRPRRAGGKGRIARDSDDVLVIFGDTPLIRPQTLLRIREALAKGAAVVVLGFRPRNPTGYGRLVVDGDELVAIREEARCVTGGARHRALQWRSDGVCRSMRSADPRADRQRQPQRRIYLTDAVAIARAMGRKAVVDRDRGGRRARDQHQAQLAETEAALQQRLRRAAMEAGVTLVAPETVFLVAGHHVRPRRGGGAVRGVRTRRHR